jgi:N-acetyl-1-D-myo-inositol-2-amino-2-deoxy-alpha-D-glucopyranoside deacetylase
MPCLMLVHAHPDDEALTTGGTMARYASVGVRVVLVTCTNGEVGEVAEVPELGTVDEIRERLGEVRTEELKEACRRLGDIDLRMLGYHDSGMEGTPANDDPKAFINQNPAAAVSAVAAIIRDTRPDVLITYNEIGLYGHPDHIRAHEVAMAGVQEASDQHAVAKVYYTAVPRSMLFGGRELASATGVNPDDFFTVEEIDRMATDDDAVTASIDVSGFVDRKFAALEAHRTQLGTTGIFLGIPEELRVLALGTEHYVLARTTLKRPTGRETDLFAM